MSLSVVILAAGKSTRFRSSIPKVLHQIGESPMIDYPLSLAESLSSRPPVIVVGDETENAIESWAGGRAEYVYQKRRLGTGHAVLQARSLLEQKTDCVLTLYGDMPLIQQETLEELIRLRHHTDAAMAMVTVIRDNPRGFGRVLRDENGYVLRVVEEPEATPEQLTIRELNAGIYVYKSDFLWSNLPRLEPSAEKGEIYLTDMVELAVKQGHHVADLVLDDPTETMGVNTRVDFAAALDALRERINERWMLQGVTLIDPATTYIGPQVMIGQDTVIHPNTHLRGKTIIGESCEIGPNSLLADTQIGHRCRVLASVLEEAVMDDDSDVGPFSHLRKGAHVKAGAHVGNFGEIKNSTLGRGAKMGHVSYLGDATVGEDVNIGAGTITCNFDGQRKHPTEIGDGAFIGSGSMLVAPLRIGSGAKTGAGSVVTHDLPADTLAYGVPARPRKPLNQQEERNPEPDVDDQTK
jgi:bifunctional UDP-N-acetylglucosamine pyrophosphorylase / glucosamine-1-phosphate N-acetyltransferase